MALRARRRHGSCSPSGRLGGSPEHVTPLAMWRALCKVEHFVVGLLLWVVHIWAFLIGIAQFPVW